MFANKINIILTCSYFNTHGNVKNVSREFHTLKIVIFRIKRFVLSKKHLIFLVKSKLTTAKKSKTTTFSRVFHPNKNRQLFSWNQSCQQLKSPKPQHFHEFFTQNFYREVCIPGILLLSFGDGKGSFRWSPMAKGGGGTLLGGWVGVVLGDGPCWLMPERSLLSITLVGRFCIGVVTSALHSGHKNKTVGGATPPWQLLAATPPFDFLCLATKSSRHGRQNVCWQGRTRCCEPKGSRQTEHSKRSVRPSRDAPPVATVGVAAVMMFHNKFFIITSAPPPIFTLTESTEMLRKDEPWCAILMTF